MQTLLKLKTLQKLKNPPNFAKTLAQTQTHHFGFGRFEKIIKKEHKSFENNQFVSETLKKAKENFITDPKNLKNLTEALDPEKPVHYQKQFSVDKQKLRKVLRNRLVKKVDEQRNVVHEYAKQQNDFIKDQLFSTQLNQHYIEEVKAFKKLYFEKKETQRLIEKEKLKKENIINASSQNNMLKGYEENLEKLQNIRINDMISYSKDNQKLALLISSGLLDKDKNLTSIIQEAQKEHQNQIQIQNQNQNQNQQNQLPNNSFIPNVNIYQLQNKQNQENNASQIQSQNNQNQILDLDSNNNIKTQNNSENLPVINQKTNNNLEEEQKYVQQFSKMGLDLTSDELKFVDFSLLKTFFDEFILTTPEEKLKTINKLQIMQQIKDYERYIFEKYRNNDITLRVKGRIQYKDLTEAEQLNYIKYNINKIDSIFHMFSEIKENIQPEVTSQLIQKISSFQYKKENLLSLTQHQSYKAIQRQFISQASQLDQEHFVDSVFSFGKIHHYELGVTAPKLYKKLNEVIAEQILERVDYLTLDETSFLLRGVVKLDLNKNQQIQEKIINYIENNLFVQNEEINENENNNIGTENLYAIQGYINYLQYLPQTKKSSEILIKIYKNIQQNPEIYQNQVDELAIVDFLGGFSYLLTKHHNQWQVKKIVTEFIKTFETQIFDQCLNNLEMNGLKNLLLILNHIEYSSYKMLKAIKKQSIEIIKQNKKIQPNDPSLMISGLAQQDLLRNNKKYLLNKLTKSYLQDKSNKQYTNLNTLYDLNSISQFFPKIVFNNKSPNYIIYSKLAKIISDQLFLLSPKWISLAVYGLASVDYRNFEFSEEACKYIMSRNEEDSDRKPKTVDLQHISMLILSYSLHRRVDETLFHLIEYMKSLYVSQNYKKATPIAWIYYINTIVNLRLLEGQKDEEQEKEFIKIIFFDKILDHLQYLSFNNLLSTLYSIVNLEINEPNIIYPLVEFTNLKIEQQNLTGYQQILLEQINLYLRQQNLQVPEEYQQSETPQNQINNTESDSILDLDLLDEQEKIQFQQEIQEQQQKALQTQKNHNNNLIQLQFSHLSSQKIVEDYEKDLQNTINDKQTYQRYTFSQIFEKFDKILNFFHKNHQKILKNPNLILNFNFKTHNCLEKIGVPFHLTIEKKIENNLIQQQQIPVFMYSKEHCIYPYVDKIENIEENEVTAFFSFREKLLENQGYQVKHFFFEQYIDVLSQKLNENQKLILNSFFEINQQNLEILEQNGIKEQELYFLCNLLFQNQQN